MNTDEKRRFPRLPIFSAALITHAGQGWLSEVRDLSQGGACLVRPQHWVDDERRRCRIYFIFDQETVIAIDADSVRQGPHEIGFEFQPDQEASVEALLYESRFIGNDEP